MRRAGLIAAIVVALGGAAAADEPAKVAEETASATTGGVYEHDIVEVKAGKKPIKALTIDNQLGDIRIEGHDGTGLVIFAYKHAPDDGALDQLRVSLIPDPDGPVRITTAVDRAAEKSTLPAGEIRVDLVIHAPRNAKIDARVGRGHLVLRNMDAGGELDAGAGAITVENVAGSVFARSVDGNQSFEEVFGDLDAQALAADLLFDTVRGSALIASVHDGRIEARHIASKQVELRTTRGTIEFDSELAMGGKLVVSSRHGDVDVRIRSGGASSIRLKARAGGTLALEGAEQSSSAADEWVRTRYGKGKRAAAIELRSRYGDVRFAIVE